MSEAKPSGHQRPEAAGPGQIAGPDAPRSILAARILELTEEELARVERGDVLDLADLQRRRAEALSGLEQPLAEPARASLRLALALQARVSERLGERLGETAQQLGLVVRGRTAAQGYAPAGAPRPRTLDRTA